MSRIFVALLLILVSIPVLAKTIEPSVLSTEIAARVDRVPEFKWIHEEARREGIRVWLFGGTAAAFAHYVAWDLEREAGDHRYLESRFDYDYTNIFRSTQDLDIVVDGTPEQVDRFREKLRGRYPYLEGSRQVWEVRALRHATGRPGGYGYKEALLDDPDMKNQHTDSNSVGMVEVTAESIEPRVRDLRDWNAEEKGRPARFLKDVATKKIHYYFSKKHESTARARLGQNPPILSVIRALTKAYQFGLTFPEPDLKRIRQIIDEFDPAQVDSRAVSKIEQAGLKLIQHAVDIEAAVTQLDSLGLRTKLALVSQSSDEESLKVWMEKEPLRTKPVGRPGPDGKLGKTAKDLEISVVAHETKTFVAYESITRATTGVPNVLISRQRHIGETAFYGDGFYTQVGREGARGTNLTIRFVLDPKAREGSDFKLVGDYVIILNKAAIRVIPESLNFTLIGYLEFLKTSKIDATDKALLEKLNRRMERYKAELTPESIASAEAIVIEAALALDEKSNTAIFSEWQTIVGDEARPKVVEALMKTSRGRRLLIESGLSSASVRSVLESPDHLTMRIELIAEIAAAFAEKRNDNIGANLAFRWLNVYRQDVHKILGAITTWRPHELWQLERFLPDGSLYLHWKEVREIDRLLSRYEYDQAKPRAENLLWHFTSGKFIQQPEVITMIRIMNRGFDRTNMGYVNANTNMSPEQSASMLEIARTLMQHRANAYLTFKEILLQSRTFHDPMWVSTVRMAADTMNEAERRIANDVIRTGNVRDSNGYLLDINTYRTDYRPPAVTGNGLSITLDIGQMLPEHIQRHIRNGGSVEISVGGVKCQTSNMFR